MRWTLTLACVGMAIGLLAGAGAASTVDPAAAGGDGVKTLFQWHIFELYTGLGMGIGGLIGFAIDYATHSFAGSRRDRLFGTSSSSTRYSSQEEQGAVIDSAISRSTARIRRRHAWIASGMTAAEADEQEAEFSRQAEIAAEEARQSKVTEAAKLPPLGWLN